MTQEFHISVTPIGEDEYLVRTERVPSGVPLTEEQVNWPVAHWVAQAQQLLNPGLATASPVTVGQQLYDALFQETIRDSWLTAQGIAQHQRQGLRLRLGLKDLQLYALPWELLHDGYRWIAASADIVFSRDQPNLGLVHSTSSLEPLHQNQALKVLLAIAPADEASLQTLKHCIAHLVTELRYTDQISTITNAGETLTQGRGPVELTILEQPDRKQLTQALEQGEYQVFHYLGHRGFTTRGDHLCLMNRKTGLSETLQGEDLAGLLVNNGICLAAFNFFDSDSSVWVADSIRQPTLVAALVQRGIPAVLTMAQPIPTEVGLAMMRLFYLNLQRSYSVDLSVHQVRQEFLATDDRQQFYWAFLVLYLHPEFNGDFSQLMGAEVDAFTASAPVSSTDRVPLLPNQASPMGQLVASNFPYTPDELELLSQTQGERIDQEESIEFLHPAEDDDQWSYEEDAAFVSDLLHQLGQSNSGTPPLKVASSGTAAPQCSSSEVEVGEANLPLNSPQNALIDPSTSHSVSNLVVKKDTYSPAQDPRPVEWLPHLQNFLRSQSVLGGSVLLAIAMLALGLLTEHITTLKKSGSPTLTATSPTTSSQPNAFKPAQVNLKTASTASVTAEAILNFNQGNLSSGQQAVRELLDRVALPQAQSALASVPSHQISHPEISFLKGRLAWQFVQIGNHNYSVADARRYWEAAIQGQPDSVLYYNALGFAYYAEGKLSQADRAWFQALYLLEENQAARAKGQSIAPKTPDSPTASTATGQTPLIVLQKDWLTAYAGLALVLARSAQNQPPTQQTSLLSRAKLLYQKVLTDDPIAFQPEGLSRNWMWSEQAIKDWRSLAQQ